MKHVGPRSHAAHGAGGTDSPALDPDVVASPLKPVPRRSWSVESPGAVVIAGDGGTGGDGGAGVPKRLSANATSSARRRPSGEFQPQKVGIWMYQDEAKLLYGGIKVQGVVAVLICCNFLTNIVEKQIDPIRLFHPDVWSNFELFYNVVFTIELLVNMYGSWFKEFWMSGWNVFDFIVVAIGLLSTAKVELPGPLKMLRMMRAFRVFRLFKKIKSLNKIVVSLVHAIPGMMNAFFINMLFMCIYAVLAVDLFGHAEKVILNCEEHGNSTTYTGREICWGEEYYHTFARSLYTLFQILTGDSWSEAVVRPIFLFFDNPFDQFASGVFFVSFILLNAVVLINVVVAVLLDKMEKSQDEDEEEREEGRRKAKAECAAEDLLQGGKDIAHVQAVGGASGSSTSDATTVADITTLRTEVKRLSADMRAEMTVQYQSLDNISMKLAGVLADIELVSKGSVML